VGIIRNLYFKESHLSRQLQMHICIRTDARISLFISFPPGLDLFPHFSSIQCSIKRLVTFSVKYMYLNKKQTIPENG